MVVTAVQIGGYLAAGVGGADDEDGAGGNLGRVAVGGAVELRHLVAEPVSDRGMEGFW